jgi:hypothetical protein
LKLTWTNKVESMTSQNPKINIRLHCGTKIISPRILQRVFFMWYKTFKPPNKIWSRIYTYNWDSLSCFQSHQLRLCCPSLLIKPPATQYKFWFLIFDFRFSIFFWLKNAYMHTKMNMSSNLRKRNVPVKLLIQKEKINCLYTSILKENKFVNTKWVKKN